MKISKKPSRIFRRSKVRFFAMIQVACADTLSSQIFDFAVSVPVLTVRMFGIIDFSNSSNLKQKLDIAVQEGAGVSVSKPLSDVPIAAPHSPAVIGDAV